MPPGWTQQWDQNSQRWFYVEQATGRTQWDPPSHLPPGPYAPPAAGAPYVPAAGHDERGLFGNTHGHQGHDYTASGQATNEAEKKKGHSTAMLAAAGIGGIAAGAFIGHQLGTFSSSLPLFIFPNLCRTTNSPQPMIVTTKPRLLQPQPQPQRLLLIHMATAPLHTVLLHRIPMRTLQPSKNLHQFLLTTQMAPPSQVATVSLWRRSARSSLRHRKRTKRSLRRPMMIKRCDFPFLFFQLNLFSH